MEAERLLPDFVAAFVPLKILIFKQRGGPTDYEFSLVRDRWQQMVDRGEGMELLFREPGKTGQSVGVLVELIAILAFTPGGITIFDHHFEAVSPSGDRADK